MNTIKGEKQEQREEKKRGYLDIFLSHPAGQFGGYARAYQNSDQRTAELSEWLHRYNWHRPHGSLKAKTPISRLGLSEDNLLRLHS